MKEYCVDLEIAKELKENGFPQESYFRYVQFSDGGWELLNVDEYVQKYMRYSAPTTDEFWKQFSEIKIEKINNSYSCDFSDPSYKKPSNALAKKWLYLKKEGYIK